jgi:hypothetical protein
MNSARKPVGNTTHPEAEAAALFRLKLLSAGPARLM